MQSDRRVEPTQCHRCFAEDVGTSAAGAGGDGEIELTTDHSSSANSENIDRVRRQPRSVPVWQMLKVSLANAEGQRLRLLTSLRFR